MNLTSHRARERLFLPVATGVLLLAIWQLVAARQLIGSGAIPTPVASAQALWGQVRTGGFWGMIGTTIGYWVIGLAIASALAVLLGIAIGLSPIARDFTQSFVDFARSFPHVALIPIAVIIFGTSMQMVLVMVLVGALWPLLIHATDGVSDLDPVALDTARAFRLTRSERFRHVVLPGAVPMMAAGMRISAAIALILVIVTGMIAGSPGLGRGIVSAEQAGDSALMYALILTTGLIGLALNGVFDLTERRLLHWHASQRRLAP